MKPITKVLFSTKTIQMVYAFSVLPLEILVLFSLPIIKFRKLIIFGQKPQISISKSRRFTNLDSKKGFYSD